MTMKDLFKKITGGMQKEGDSTSRFSNRVGNVRDEQPYLKRWSGKKGGRRE